MSLHHTVGIDVSKTRLDAHRLPDGAAAEFDNTTAGFRRLIAWSGEDDRRDARVLADAVRTDPHCLRELRALDPTVAQLREWSRMADDLTKERTRLVSLIYKSQHTVCKGQSSLLSYDLSQSSERDGKQARRPEHKDI